MEKLPEGDLRRQGIDLPRLGNDLLRRMLLPSHVVILHIA